MGKDDWYGEGCGSHSCKYEKPKGQGVNGPCRCDREREDDNRRTDQNTRDEV
jgi:hypothetical protein